MGVADGAVEVEAPGEGHVLGQGDQGLEIALDHIDLAGDLAAVAGEEAVRRQHVDGVGGVRIVRRALGEDVGVAVDAVAAEFPAHRHRDRAGPQREGFAAQVAGDHVLGGHVGLEAVGGDVVFRGGRHLVAEGI